MIHDGLGFATPLVHLAMPPSSRGKQRLYLSIAGASSLAIFLDGFAMGMTGSTFLVVALFSVAISYAVAENQNARVLQQVEELEKRRLRSMKDLEVLRKQMNDLLEMET